MVRSTVEGASCSATNISASSPTWLDWWGPDSNHPVEWVGVFSADAFSALDI